MFPTRTAKESLLALFILIFSSLLITVGNSKAARDLGEEDPGRDGYYDEETPADWADILFIFVICLLHFEYAFKFTDYSLAHIHLAEHKVRVDKDDKDLAALDLESLKKLATASFNSDIKDSDQENVLTQKVEVFSTLSDDGSQHRMMHNRICCCVTWAPRFFTWKRTYVIRTFLKLYVCVSCLLAMVLYVEFFMNLFVEYLITCIVHYDEYYVFALLMVPILLFVCDILIRLAWQSVVVSWSLNADTNGDLEAMDSSVGIYALRTRLSSSKKLLYTFTSDARDNYNYDMYTEEQDELVKEREEEEALRKLNQIGKSPSYKDMKLDEVDEHKRTDVELTTKSDTAATENLDPSKRKRKLTVGERAAEALQNLAGNVVDVVEDVVEDVGDAIKDGAIEVKIEVQSVIAPSATQVLTPHQQKEQYISQIQRAADKEAYRQKMGDYFMATCWRFHFFIYTMIGACLAAWSVEVDVAVNGFFWQLVMRYCVLGGVIWSMVYTVGAFFVAIASRYSSWKLIHEHIPRWKLFFLIDAHDYETNNKGWSCMKIIIMAMSLVIFVVFVGVSWWKIDEAWSSFLHFVGIIFALYYCINLFMACKPFALVALWTDNIPPPGKNYTAHQIASETLRDRGLLKNSLRSTVHVMDGTKANDDSFTNEDVNDEDLKVAAKPEHLQVSSVSPEKPQANEDVDTLRSVSAESTTPQAVALKDTENMDMTDTLRQMKQKKEKYKSFRSQRASDLQRRYEAFTYVYGEVDRNEFEFCGTEKCKFLCQDGAWFGNCAYMRELGLAFLKNYEQYWLNVYRPFDEYDIESNLSASHILAGFQWLKGICQCAKRSRRKKTCGQKCYTVAKYLMDNFCNICVLLTTFVFMYILFQTSQRLSGNKDAFRERVIYETNETAYYGICNDKFGAAHDSRYDISVLDMTVLTQLAYEADNYDLCQVINIWFNGTYELIKIHRQEPFYFHIRHREAAVDIIAIRGTDNVIEMMQDLSLFVEVAIFEGLQWIVPFLNGLPITFIRQILYYASYIEGVINADARVAFDEPVYKYAYEYLSRLENGVANCSYDSSTIENWDGATSLYLVGHSLGGGIAQIVAANLHEANEKRNSQSSMQSFGVCSPGVLLSSAKFGFGVEALDKTSSSLLPRRDLVSSVDFHGGSIQYTECDAGNMLQCHVMDNVLCELFYGCPEELVSEEKRKWLIDFCETSSADTDDNPQIGKSIKKISERYPLEEISDWKFSRVLAQCDNKIYENCLHYNLDLADNCDEIDYHYTDNEDNICFSEAQLGHH